METPMTLELQIWVQGPAPLLLPNVQAVHSKTGLFREVKGLLQSAKHSGGATESALRSTAPSGSQPIREAL